MQGADATYYPDASQDGGDGERPPWLENAAEPTHWDLAFGSYGDGYLEWVTSRYFWDPDDLRTTADSRSLWDKRARYAPESLFAEMNFADGQR